MIATPIVEPTATSSASSPRRRVGAHAGDQLEHDQPCDRAPQRRRDGGFLAGAERPSERQHPQRQGGAAEDRRFLGERLPERGEREALVHGQATPEDVGVGVGEPVDGDRDRRRGDRVEVALVEAALGGEQRAEDDQPVDDPRGVLARRDRVGGARQPPAQGRAAACAVLDRGRAAARSRDYPRALSGSGSARCRPRRALRRRS